MMTIARRQRNPVWPSVGPDRGEDILKFKPECLSPGWQKEWERAYFARDPIGRLLDKQAKELGRLEDEIEHLREQAGNSIRRPRKQCKGQGVVLRTDE